MKENYAKQKKKIVVCENEMVKTRIEKMCICILHTYVCINIKENKFLTYVYVH